MLCSLQWSSSSPGHCVGLETHQRDVLVCATTDSLFTHHHKHNLYSTHILSLERKYIHILIEIKIQTYCKKLNRATARCAVGTLLSVRTDEESKKIFLAWSPTPLHINCALPEILPLVYHTVYRTIFRTSMENQPDKKTQEKSGDVVSLHYLSSRRSLGYFQIYGILALN